MNNEETLMWLLCVWSTQCIDCWKQCESGIQVLKNFNYVVFGWKNCYSYQQKKKIKNKMMGL